MDLGDIKGDMSLCIILELNKLLPYLIVVQEGKFVFPYWYSLGVPRVVIEGIVIAESVFVKDLVYQLTSFAAKNLIAQFDLVIGTIFSAVGAL